jgi:hypothetical protein
MYGLKPVPFKLKATLFFGFCGTTKVMPFQSKTFSADCEAVP